MVLNESTLKMRDDAFEVHVCIFIVFKRSISYLYEL